MQNWIDGGSRLKTIAIFPNTKKEKVREVLDWLIPYFEERNVRVVIPEKRAAEANYPELAGDLGKLKASISCCITLGGDGTMLSVARTIAAYGIPIFGVNLGTLGFLTEVEVSNLHEAVEKIVTGRYTVEDRLMLDCWLVKNGEKQFISSALNDVVITKGAISRIIRVKLFIEDVLAAEYPADGLIVATSTGSTGYSLAAGGPVVNPNIDVVILTPICAHTLYSRPMVISDKEEVKVALQSSHNNIILTVDGQIVHPLNASDLVIIKPSPHKAKFLVLGETHYYTKLRSKLGED